MLPAISLLRFPSPIPPLKGRGSLANRQKIACVPVRGVWTRSPAETLPRLLVPTPLGFRFWSGAGGLRGQENKGQQDKRTGPDRCLGQAFWGDKGDRDKGTGNRDKGTGIWGTRGTGTGVGATHRQADAPHLWVGTYPRRESRNGTGLTATSGAVT